MVKENFVKKCFVVLRKFYQHINVNHNKVYLRNIFTNVNIAQKRFNSIQNKSGDKILLNIFKQCFIIMFDKATEIFWLNVQLKEYSSNVLKKYSIIKFWYIFLKRFKNVFSILCKYFIYSAQAQVLIKYLNAVL